eukprot:scaffold9342_cov63-Phaeocystis_antarctica.AAC.2
MATRDEHGTEGVHVVSVIRSRFHSRRSTRASAVALAAVRPKRSASILALELPWRLWLPRPRRAAAQPAALGCRRQQPGVVAQNDMAAPRVALTTNLAAGVKLG